MPSLITFSPVPQSLFPDLKALTADHDRIAETLGDTTFVSVDSTHFARLFDGDTEPEQEYRRLGRFTAEAMLLQNGLADIVHIGLVGTRVNGLTAPKNSQSISVSPAQSYASLSHGETDTGSDDDGEALTPPMGSSMQMLVAPVGAAMEYAQMKAVEKKLAAAVPDVPAC
jgi:hypothetical protein